MIQTLLHVLHPHRKIETDHLDIRGLHGLRQSQMKFRSHNPMPPEAVKVDLQMYTVYRQYDGCFVGSSLQQNASTNDVPLVEYIVKYFLLKYYYSVCMVCICCAQVR